MAYSDPHVHAHGKLASIGGVALVHLALAFGLVSGLAVKYFDPPEETTPDGVFVELPDPPEPDDPPPPDPSPRDTPVETTSPPIYVPTPPLDLPRMPTVPTTPDLPVIDTLPIPRLPVDPGPPTPPPPAFDAHGPIPLNGPLGWITNAEYPLRAIQREEEGSANYAVDVGTDGRVDDCRITSSTGSRQLDEATCRWVTRRARFEPAINENGARIAGTYRGSVTWQIPER